MVGAARVPDSKVISGNITAQSNEEETALKLQFPGISLFSLRT